MCHKITHLFHLYGILKNLFILNFTQSLIVEEVCDEVNNPDSILSRPFIKETQQFFKEWYEKYKGALLF